MSAGRLALAFTVAAGLVVATAAPAGAHGGQGAERAPASNYRTTITGVAPDVDGLELRVREAGSRIELTNDTGRTVVVLGYQEEPYLRIDANGGVYRNTRSPATYANEDRQARTEVPDEADPQAEPRWQKLSNGRTVRWHDHRIHWMGDARPPAVAADPTTPQTVIGGWEIPLEVDGRAATVTGDLDWVPPPSPWPWIVGAIAIGAGTLAAARRWGRAAVLVATATLIVATVVEAAGSWAASTSSLTGKLGEVLVPAMAWTILVAAATQLWRAHRDASLLVGGAAAGLAWLFGLSDWSWLFASQLSTGLAPGVARAAIITALGVGSALTISAALDARELLVAADRPRPRPAASPVPADEHRGHRRALIVALVVVALAFVLATAPSR